MNIHLLYFTLTGTTMLSLSLIDMPYKYILPKIKAERNPSSTCTALGTKLAQKCFLMLFKPPAGVSVYAICRTSSIFQRDIISNSA